MDCVCYACARMLFEREDDGGEEGSVVMEGMRKSVQLRETFYLLLRD